MRMPSSLSLMAVILAAVPSVALAQSYPFERTLEVGTTPTLEASTGSGTIAVRAVPGSRIVVRGVVSVRKGSGVPSNADALARQLAAAPPVTQSGDVVTVGRIADDATNRAVSVSYEIDVPTPTSVRATTGSGDVTISGVGGTVKANSGSGDVKASDLAGALSVRTGSGDIRVEHVRAGAELSTGSGSVRATLEGRGDVNARTGSGDIELTGVNGALTASTGSGDVSVNGTPTSDWKISAASGDVVIAVPEGRGFALQASTSSGRFQLAPEIAVQGQVEKRRISGTVRGGGPTLHLRTASGNIAVR